MCRGRALASLGVDVDGRRRRPWWTIRCSRWPRTSSRRRRAATSRTLPWARCTISQISRHRSASSRWWRPQRPTAPKISLDGIHPSGDGQLVFAHAAAQALNETFHLNIPLDW